MGAVLRAVPPLLLRRVRAGLDQPSEGGWGEDFTLERRRADADCTGDEPECVRHGLKLVLEFGGQWGAQTQTRIRIRARIWVRWAVGCSNPGTYSNSGAYSSSVGSGVLKSRHALEFGHVAHARA